MTLRRALLGALCAVGGFGVSAGAATGALPPVKHVWVIVLENENYASSFGASSSATYLSKTLPAQGQLLTQYYGTTHLSLGNYVAMVSGQASNVLTQSDCQVFQDIFPGVIGPDGQAIGQGCVYPSTVKTVADQLEAKGLSWKGYAQDMGTACRHPALDSRDDTQSARAGDQYAARHNPFVYFHSLIDTPSCAANDVPLDRLATDLASPASSASFSLVVPNLCEDGHDAPCVDGRPGGLTSADAFLQTWVPRITGSPAYADGGMLVVTFDEADATPGKGDASSCCAQPGGYNTPNPGGPIPGVGGGRVGAVVLSPFVTPGTVNATPYNHYALLRSVEDLYGVDHLGYAGAPGLRAFGDDVFTQP